MGQARLKERHRFIAGPVITLNDLYSLVITVLNFLPQCYCPHCRMGFEFVNFASSIRYNRDLRLPVKDPHHSFPAIDYV
jgi:hypothetical protein